MAESKEHPNIGRLRARAIKGLDRWISDLATLQENRVDASQAQQHINTIQNIENWRQNQMGIWQSLMNLFTKSSMDPIAQNMLSKVTPIITAYNAGGQAYNTMQTLTPQQLVAMSDDDINRLFDGFYSNIQLILKLSKEYLMEKHEDQLIELESPENFTSIFDVDDAYNTPMALALSNMFLIEAQIQRAENLKQWSRNVAMYTDFFEIPLHIRINVLNKISTLDLTEPGSIEEVNKLLTGLVTNSRMDNQPAKFFYDPQLVARGRCSELINDLRTHCNTFQPNDPRMHCVAQVGDGMSSEQWVQNPNPANVPHATDKQMRDVLNYFHAYVTGGIGVNVRLPIMESYFANLRQKIDEGLPQARSEMEKRKRHLVHSLGKYTSNHPESIWLVDTMWKNLDAVFPGCIQQGRNFGEPEIGFNEAAAALADLPVGGKKRRKSLFKKKRTKRKRRKRTRRRKRKTKKRRKRRKKRTKYRRRRSKKR